MRFENRRWVILNASEAEDIDFSKVLQASADTLRWNNDNTKTFVKYEGPQPSFLMGKTVLTHSQVLSELENEEWQAPDLADVLKEFDKDGDGKLNKEEQATLRAKKPWWKFW